jgi:hypothetical protein
MGTVDDDLVPPLPKGYAPVKQEAAPPLPKGFSPVEPKKDGGAGSPLSPTGSKPSPDHSELAALMQGYEQHLSPKEREDYHKSMQSLIAKPDRIRAATKEEIEGQKAMDTTLGKVKKSLAYIGSETTKGGVQVLKGGAWVLNHMNTSLSDTQLIPDKAFKGIDKATDLGVTPGQRAQIEGGKGLGMGAVRTLGMIGNIAPAALAGEVAGIPKTMFALQGMGQGKETMDTIDPEHKINPAVRDLYIAGSGAVNGLIMGDLGEGLLSKPVQEKVVNGIVSHAVADAAEKGLTEDALKESAKNAVKDFSNKFYELAEKTGKTGLDLSALQAAQYALKKGVDVASPEPVFNANLGELMSNISDVVTKQAPLFGGIGAMLGGSAKDPIEVQKRDLGEQVDALDKQIAGKTAEQPQDAVGKVEQKVEVDRLTKQKDELTNNLETLISKQHDESTKIPPAKEEVKGNGEQMAERPEDSAKGQETTDAEKDGKGLLKKGGEEPPLKKRQVIPDSEAPQVSELSRNLKETGKPGISIESSYEREYEKPNKLTENELNNGNKYIVSRDKDGRVNGVLEISYNGENGLEKEPTDVKVAVSEGDRRKGIGTALFKHAEEQGIDLSKIRGTATTEAGQKLYEANLKSKQNAIQEQTTDEGLLRQERPEMGLQEVGKGDTEPKESTEKVTGIRNEDIQKERGQAVEREKKKLDDVHAEGKRLVDSGEVDPDQLAKDVTYGKKVANEEEQAALRYHKTKLVNRQRQLLRDSEANPERAAENHIEHERTADLIEQNRAATEKIGNIAGRTLRDRQEALAEDYSRVHILQRAKQANSGKPLPPDLEKELATRTKRIEELESKLSDREERIRKLEEQATVSKIGESQRKSRKEVTRAKLREERQEILADLHSIARKARSSAGANKIPVEMIVPLTKLAVNYVADGITSLGIVVDKVYDDLKDHIDGLTRDDVHDVIKDGFDKYVADENKARLETAKKKQLTKLESLRQQRESGDIETRTQRKLAVDNDYLKIRADIKREQTLINKQIAEIANSKKEIGRKAADFAVKWGRWAKLASVTVLGKLAAAGLTTLSVKIPEELIGSGYSKLLPRIAKKADFEAGMNLRELAKSYAKGATQGMKDAADELNIKKGGQSDLSALYGKDVKGRLPAEAADFWGHLHSAIKAPFKRAIWEYSYAKRFEAAARKGLDPTDQVIDATNRLNAYKDAERAIFMGDNKLSSAYEAAMRTLENSSSSMAQNVAALTRILLPFVKVPTNIALEGGRYAFGSLAALKLARVGISDVARRAGAEKLASLFHKGMGELKPEEAEQILNNLKKGSIGGAALLLGFYNPQNFGGFYQPGEHRKKGEVEEGSIKVFGEQLPKFMNEHPIFLAMQIGATFRRVMDAHRKKDDNIEAATLATASGLAQAIPLANGADEILGALHSSDKFNKLVGNQIKGEVEPALIQQLAAATDTKDKSTFTLDPKKQQKRQPDKKHGLLKYVKEDLETGLPGLRQNVKIKK